MVTICCQRHPIINHHHRHTHRHVTQRQPSAWSFQLGQPSPPQAAPLNTLSLSLSPSTKRTRSSPQSHSSPVTACADDHLPAGDGSKFLSRSLSLALSCFSHRQSRVLQEKTKKKPGHSRPQQQNWICNTRTGSKIAVQAQHTDVSDEGGKRRLSSDMGSLGLRLLTEQALPTSQALPSQHKTNN